jgi:Zn-dependent M28 family amino/carboxypeptidase
VCGHLDSWDLGSGAIDNGIGSFTIPDIAGAIQSCRQYLKRNVLFLLTMGEEQGLLGSRAIVESMRNEGRLNDLKAVVNLDMTGNPIAINDFDWKGARNFFAVTEKIIRKNHSNFTREGAHEPGLHSDHQPFMLEGIPSFSMVSSMPDSVYACYHADCDNINLVGEMYMKNSALAHSIMVLDLASREELGFTRMRPGKLAKWLKSHRLKEKLEISGEWKWD